jgi:hypothetical protein
MLVWIEKIWLPFVAANNAFSLLIIDSFSVSVYSITWSILTKTFKVHYVESVINKINSSGTSLHFIPGGGTSKLQVLDVGINKPFKDALKDLSTRYTSEQAMIAIDNP